MALKLKRELGLFEATLYGVGVIIGAGIYVLIGPAAGLTGNSLWISFIIGALISVFTGLSYAELSTMYPKEAAEFIYIKKASQSKFLAFVISWLILFTAIISVSTVSLGFASYFGEVVKFFIKVPEILIAALLITFLSYVNYLGIKESSKLNILFTGISVLGLLVIIFLGFQNFGKVDYLEMPFGLHGILAAAALIFFAYLGFEDIANISEETKNPKKVMPKAFILSITITTILYALTAVATVSLADWSELSASPAPLALAASKVFGENAFLFISFISWFATSSTVLILLIVVSRMSYGMARENSLPRFLNKLDKKRKTPWRAIMVGGFFSILFLFIEKIQTIAEITSLSAFITFSAVNASLIWLRYSKPDVIRPFRTPINIGKFPIIAFLGLLFNSLMITQFEKELLLFGVAILISGIIVYKFRENKIIA